MDLGETGAWRSRGRGNCSQDILHERTYCIFNLKIIIIILHACVFTQAENKGRRATLRLGFLLSDFYCLSCFCACAANSRLIGPRADRSCLCLPSHPRSAGITDVHHHICLPRWAQEMKLRLSTCTASSLYLLSTRRQPRILTSKDFLSVPQFPQH